MEKPETGGEMKTDARQGLRALPCEHERGLVPGRVLMQILAGKATGRVGKKKAAQSARVCVQDFV